MGFQELSILQRPWLASYPSNIEENIDSVQSHIVDCWNNAVSRYRKRPCVAFEGLELTYGEIDVMSDRMAGYLATKIKIEPGERVAVILPNSPAYLISFLGILKAGGVVVNMNPLYTKRELLFQLNDSGAVVAVASDFCLNKLIEIQADTCVEHLIVADVGDQLPLLKGLLFKARIDGFRGLWSRKHAESLPAIMRDETNRNPFPPPIKVGDIAVLQYTGGVTGICKGAMLTHGNIVANIHQLLSFGHHNNINCEDVVLVALPLHHAFALTANMLTFLCRGAKMVLVPKPTPIKNTVKVFQNHSITVMAGVSPIFRALCGNRAFRDMMPGTLRLALAGGAPLNENVGKKFERLTGVSVREGFGLTEASPATHSQPLVGLAKLGSCGIPLPSTDAKIVDDDGKVLGPHEVGELLVKGPQVMRGYWQHQEETARVMEDGWLRTGDKACFDEDGYFFIVGRSKEMILVSGFNVFPLEVESVILEVPEVLECSVVGRKVKVGGEQVVAYLVVGSGFDESELRAHLEKNLAYYKRPRQFRVVDSLPTDDLGKVHKNEIAPDIA